MINNKNTNKRPKKKIKNKKSPVTVQWKGRVCAVRPAACAKGLVAIGTSLPGPYLEDRGTYC